MGLLICLSSNFVHHGPAVIRIIKQKLSTIAEVTNVLHISKEIVAKQYQLFLLFALMEDLHLTRFA
jgi:hypothetical protein